MIISGISVTVNEVGVFIVFMGWEGSFIHNFHSK